MQRAACHPALEQAPLLQVFDEEGQLAHRCHRRCVLPFEMHPAGKGFRCHRTFGCQLYRRLLTPRVNRRHPCCTRHPQHFRQNPRPATHQLPDLG